ncbi:MAG: hypothetical protein HKP61_16125 [Dactylosporangium sp.]|nr:hypothetical protein [Dactylosporangium sp.]NNJ62433.1 hypothetical protein [Dactylosporangium sp.]
MTTLTIENTPHELSRSVKYHLVLNRTRLELQPSDVPVEGQVVGELLFMIRFWHFNTTNRALAAKVMINGIRITRRSFRLPTGPRSVTLVDPTRPPLPPQPPPPGRPRRLPPVSVGDIIQITVSIASMLLAAAAPEKNQVGWAVLAVAAGLWVSVPIGRHGHAIAAKATPGRLAAAGMIILASAFFLLT